MPERRNFGDCVGCEQPIAPPYRTFTVRLAKAPTGNNLTEWEDADICDSCADELTVDDFYRLVTAAGKGTDNAN